MADRCLSLLIVSPDALVRLGLQAALGNQASLQVRGVSETLALALAQWRTLAPLLVQRGELNPTDAVVLVVQGQDWRSLLADLSLLTQRPLLVPLRPLVIGQPPSPGSLRQAQALGAQGYCLPSVTPEELLATVQQVAEGQFWQRLASAAPWQAQGPRLGQPPPSSPPLSPVARRLQGVLPLVQPLLRSGLRQINTALESAIEEGDRGLDDRDPTGFLEPFTAAWFDHQISQGEVRELRLAQQLLQTLLQATGDRELPQQPPPDTGSSTPAPPPNPASPNTASPTPPSLRDTTDTTGDRTQPQDFAALTPVAVDTLNPWFLGETLPDPPALQRFMVQYLTEQLQGSLTNTTPIPLEIDILRIDKKRELLAGVLACLDEQLTSLRQEDIRVERLVTQMPSLIEDLWQGTLVRFLSAYGTFSLTDLPGAVIPVQLADKSMNPVPVLGTIELISDLLQDLAVVDQAILQRIPYGLYLFQTLLWGVPLTVDGIPYGAYTPEALNRLILLLDNLLISIANGVMQPLLNRFGDVEIIKQTLYHQQLFSTRDVERFRNNLSWKYRVTLHWEIPQDIYASRYYLWSLDRPGITRIAVYAPRRLELSSLTLSQQFITLALELRDALSPRLQLLTAWLGRGVVYVLTQVVGRAIGLVGRGIVQGIGRTWLDRK
ncbi:DUF3685 domain-containing protein [Prochlorothrix hollandica]|uniref:Response regulatory domain-containing protein n=1 Tax=Prochlorothrix hollandica PCC 9006 = CALU 1027 TaxID=317619 RepID=A0A0M2PVE3_PROHO|nr:DUF3685 domain-containing protein [Prochlorothrix hollandica]KKI99087.1 hypothetical protein PROH_14980 [Prochlorothrix hollandica PCC 9006 = CALU 1027]